MVGRSRYVALGSSFAAGTGVRPEIPTCGRSEQNYPRLVAADLQLDLTDVTCAGATLGNILEMPQGECPPQIDAVSADSALVTLTAGGNDIDYSISTLQCGFHDGSYAPLLDTEAIDGAVAALPARLAAVLDAVRRRAPDATVLLVTYPEVVPAAGAAFSAFALDATDAAYIRELGERLDAAFHMAAQMSAVSLVDVYRASVGHGPMASKGTRWVNGAHVATDGFAYHPTGVGHRAVADLVLLALAEK